MQAAYQDLTEILIDAAQVLLPPERISVSEAAEKYRQLFNPGSYIGPWKNATAPYLAEVMDVLSDRHYQTCIYVKPAQSGGTEVALNWMLHSAICDPGDMVFYQTKESAARDFSKDKLAKMIRHSPEMRDQLIPGKTGDTVYHKLYRSGTRLKLSWPSINELSGHSTGRIALTDYDRMPQDVEGEGSPFFLAQKRTTTFGSFAMTLAESSPGYVLLEPEWRAPKDNPHMAPPCEGILSLYNMGDRRRWYWPCPECGAYFEPHFNLMWWDSEEKDIDIAAAAAKMSCPACGVLIDHEMKYDMNIAGHWIRERDFVALADGVAWIHADQVDDGNDAWVQAITKSEPYGDMATFWGMGPIAAFLTWEEMVLKYLRAMQEYETTGDYQSLKATVNTDQCLPFRPPHDAVERLPEDLMDRAEDFGERVVPEGVVTLLATVDVQKRRFVVQVMGISAGGDITVIDRYDITKSERVDEDGDKVGVEPPSYIEDWALLERKVLDAKYPLSDRSGRSMLIRAVGVDTGGSRSTIGRKASVTEKAYKWFRQMRRKGKHRRVFLIKGGSDRSAKKVQTTYPDAERKDRHAGARGDIPVLMLNTQTLKDELDGVLNRTEPGGGMIHFADWLELDFYRELCAEIWDAKKGWHNPKGRRNETTDLFAYCLALMDKLKMHLIDWEKPPKWAQTWDVNNFVIGNEPPKEDQQPKPTLSGMGSDLL